MKRQSIVPYVKHALKTPIPDRKFKLWQHAVEGPICGFYWHDIDFSWEDDRFPGWYYIIRKNGGEYHVHEEDIKLIDRPENAQD